MHSEKFAPLKTKPILQNTALAVMGLVFSGANFSECMNLIFFGCFVLFKV